MFYLDPEDLSDGEYHSEEEGNSGGGGDVMESTVDLSGISGTSKSALLKKISNEFNLSGEDEPRRSLKRYNIYCFDQWVIFLIGLFILLRSKGIV